MNAVWDREMVRACYKVYEMINVWLTPQCRGNRQTEGNKGHVRRLNCPGDHVLADLSVMTH